MGEQDELPRFDGDDFELTEPDEESLEEAEAIWGAESDELPSRKWEKPTGWD